MKKFKKGFTLAELLIVVAIIAVLVAISIPVFTSQLEKSREATDAANIRAQYAEVMIELIGGNTNVNTDGINKVALKQKVSGWQNEAIPASLGELGELDGTPSSGGSAWVEFQDDKVTIHFSAASAGGNGSDDETQSDNNTTAHDIGRKVIELISGANNNTQVKITVSPDGEVSVEVEKGNANKEAILNGLIDSGLVSSNGTVDFDSNDTIYANGYIIKINKNNGNGGTIHVSPIKN